MGARSQNGWPVLDRDQLHWFDAGGGRFAAANSAVAVCAAELINRYAAEVEPIDGPILDDWSYAKRNVTGSDATVSNHASATAWDLNALQHVRGRPTTFTTDEVKAIRRILAAITDNAGRQVFRWGRDYSTTRDEMHFEINLSAQSVQQARLKIEENDMALSDADKAWLKATIETAVHSEVVEVLTKDRLVDNRGEDGKPTVSIFAFAQVLAGMDWKIDYYLAPKLRTIIEQTAPVEPPPAPAPPG